MTKSLREKVKELKGFKTTPHKSKLEGFMEQVGYPNKIERSEVLALIDEARDELREACKDYGCCAADIDKIIGKKRVIEDDE